MKSSIKDFKCNISLLLLCVLTCLSACRKFIEVDPPETQLASATVFEEKYSAIAAVTSIYSNMIFINLTVSKCNGLSSDEFTSFGLESDQAFYKNALTEVKDGGVFWGNAYGYIYRANEAIVSLENSSKLDVKIKNQLLGEVKFIRAFWYFYLVNNFGDVPLVTQTDYKVIIKLPRSPRAEVYNQMITDLKDAQNLLGEDYVDSKNAVTIDRVRPTKWVATAMLARVYLFNKDFKNAELQSSEVIAHTKTFGLVHDLNGVFLKNSTEAIWQLMPVNSNLYTEEGAQYILQTTPNSLTMSPQLLGAFETDDQRARKWVGSITISNNTYYYPFKYKSTIGSTELKEYSMVLRLAEQYLIRAQARVEMDNLKDGSDDLNVIRLRAGLKETEAKTKPDLLAAILHERQVELFSEGHRWIDLKASGTIDQVMSKVTPEKGGVKWQSFQQLYPLSADDISHSLNLSQNTGY